jgi:hypothetical protein
LCVDYTIPGVSPQIGHAMAQAVSLG